MPSNSAHSFNSCAVFSVILNCKLTFFDFSFLGGLPVLGDIFITSLMPWHKYNICSGKSQPLISKKLKPQSVKIFSVQIISQYSVVKVQKTRMRFCSHQLHFRDSTHLKRGHNRPPLSYSLVASAEILDLSILRSSGVISDSSPVMSEEISLK